MMWLGSGDLLASGVQVLVFGSVHVSFLRGLCRRPCAHTACVHLSYSTGFDASMVVLHGVQIS